MEYFTKLGTRHIGLFTWSHSPKHLGLYQKFGFWPRFLTAIMAKQLVADDAPEVDQNITLGKDKHKNETALDCSRYSELPTAKDQRECLNSCRKLTNSIYDGLDLQLEINSVNTQRLGDTVLLWKDGSGVSDREKRKLIGLAVCHCGAGTEAGSGACYIKFGGVFSDANSAMYFDRLFDACETFAKEQNMSRLVAGVNTGRHEAYRKLISRGFRTEIQGVIMDRPNDPGYNKPDIYLIDDWR
jgi:hypothetical protein